MEKSKAYKEGIKIPAKKMLVKNPKIYGTIAAALFLISIVFLFLNIFKSRVGEDFSWTFNAFNVEHWFPVFCIILSAVLSGTACAIAVRATRKEGKLMGLAALLGLVSGVLLLFMLLFANTSTVKYETAPETVLQTSIMKYYAAKPMLEDTSLANNWTAAQNSFSWMGWVALGAAVVGAFVSWVYIAAIPKVTKLNAVRTLQSYAMISLSVTALSLFVVYPLLWIIRYSVFDYKGWGQMTFVGFDKFVQLSRPTSARYWQSVKNTFVFAIGKLLVEIPLALVLAFILTRKLRGANFFRAVYYMPSMVSVAVIGVIFFYLFRHEGGVFNTFIRMLGGKGVQWFSNGWSAMMMLMIASIWQNFGLNMLFFMTGLQSISPDMYEAAAIDGATNTRQFFSITVPLLGPVLQMVLMNALLGSLKVTDLVLSLTGGGPNYNTSMMMTYTYGMFIGDAGVAKGNWGFASACTVVTAIILGLVTIVYLRVTRKTADVY